MVGLLVVLSAAVYGQTDPPLFGLEYADDAPRSTRRFHASVGGFGTALLPLRVMADVCDTGLGAGGEFFFQPGDARVGPSSHGNTGLLPAFGAVFEHVTFPGTAPDVKTFSTVTAAGSFEYRLSFLPFAGLLIQGRTGVGYSTLTYKDSTAEDPVTGLHPYFGVGTGVESRFRRVAFFVTALYRVILEEDFTPYHGISIQGGVRAALRGPNGRDEEYTR
ncbi:MAG: hypothetical protein EA426_19340 [Spirochaetaceae bacterium]|nr:MAG: hypothetical protein EA426_19340 [Spirochaetaceae bacterium]